MTTGTISLKKCENDRTQVIFYEVENGTFSQEWGMEDGAKQLQTSKVTEGKNIGKANETTPAEQAVQEVRSKVNKKIAGGYQVTFRSGCFVDMELDIREDVPKPMLAKEYFEHCAKLKGRIYGQPKLDGNRCVADLHTGKLYSRTGKVITGVPHIEKQIKELGDYLDDFAYPDTDDGEWTRENMLAIRWLDGELYTHAAKTFQGLQSIIRAGTVKEDSGVVEYHVYDCIAPLEFATRDRFVVELLNDAHKQGYCDKIVDVETVEFSALVTQEEITKYHDDCVARGYEGCMVRSNAPYQNKRTDALLKLKMFKQEEYEILGMEQEVYDEIVGALVCKLADGRTFKARPAMTDEDRRDIWYNRRNYEKGWVATVKFQELTDEGIPRFPVCVGLRFEDDR